MDKHIFIKALPLAIPLLLISWWFFGIEKMSIFYGVERLYWTFLNVVFLLTYELIMFGYILHKENEGVETKVYKILTLIAGLFLVLFGIYFLYLISS